MVFLKNFDVFFFFFLKMSHDVTVETYGHANVRSLNIEQKSSQIPSKGFYTILEKQSCSLMSDF